MQFRSSSELGATILHICKITGAPASWAADLARKASVEMLEDPTLLVSLAEHDRVYDGMRTQNGRPGVGVGEGDSSDTRTRTRRNLTQDEQERERRDLDFEALDCPTPRSETAQAADEREERRCTSEGRVPDTEMTARCYLKEGHHLKEGWGKAHRAWAAPYGEFWWHEPEDPVDEGA